MANTQQATQNKPAATKNAPPAGFKKVVSSDTLVGFVNPYEEGVLLIPRSAKIMDGSIDPSKSSTLIICELDQEFCMVSTKDADVQAKKGDVVGLWYKPGMREIKNYANVSIWIEGAGEKATGKGNPMKMYNILVGTDAEGNPKKGDKLEITEDLRKFSMPENRRRAASVGEDDDDLPF